MLTLRSSPASPFGRKVKISAALLGLTDRIAVTEALADLVQGDRRERLAAGLHDLGFTWVTLDLDGFRSGSMNEADPRP